MDDTEGDIEYLDEDEDIVQQCVQAAPQVVGPVIQAAPQVEAPVTKPIPFLVERQQLGRKRKLPSKKKDEDDSDYEPDDEITAPSPPPSPEQKRKKKPVQSAVKRAKDNKNCSVQVLKRPIRILNASDEVVKIPLRMRQVTVKEVPKDRKKLNIRIPDYDDPLCMPVKAIKQQSSDYKRLSNWNNVCLEHFKHCDNLLKPEKGETRSSVRSLVFRNVLNKQSGQSETTIWSKTCVDNKDGDRKSEIFQCVLPRYKERKMLPAFGLLQRKQKPFHHQSEVLLCKEETKDDEVLVAYKPKDATASVYRLVAAFDRKSGQKKEIRDNDEEDDIKMYAKEVAHLKMCVPCYQTSWRAITKNETKHPECPVCGRTYSTVYNLMAHFKTHSTEEIRRNKLNISTMLAELLECHYKCRVCQERFPGIKKLKNHLSTHQIAEQFVCEVGNHLAK